jgi:ABC-type nitrate/sulfonate/bicarbonate transport system substrate-binding protein
MPSVKQRSRYQSLTPVLMTCLLVLASKAGGQEIYVAYPSEGIGKIPFAVAKAKRYYEAENLNVLMIKMTGGTSVRALIGGSVSFLTGLGSSLVAIVRGPDLKVLMVQADKPFYDLVAHRSIRSIPELKGKKIGVGVFGGADDTVSRTMLRKHGLNPERDVVLLQMGAPELRLPALMTGSIDASALAPPSNFRAYEQGFVKLGFAGDYMLSLTGGIITTPQLMSRDPEMVAKFVRATLKGLLFFAANRDESVAIVSRDLMIGDQKVAGQIYDYVKPTLTQDGTIPKSVMESVLQDRKKAAGVTRAIDPLHVFQFSQIVRAMAELKASGWNP